MPRQSYHQYCPIAHTLERVGERWTLLIVRELLLGPKRFTDLAHGLPGIGPNVLTSRLRALTDDGLVERRTLPPPAASTVYQLTERGHGLENVVVELGRWGLRLLRPPRDTDRFDANGLLLSWKILLPARSNTPDAVYQVDVDGHPFAIRVQSGNVSVEAGEDRNPDVRVSLDPATFREIGLGYLDVAEADAAGRIQVRGEPERIEALAALLAAGRTP